MSRYKVLYVWICLLLLSGCAKMVVPTGGPRDVTPPSVIGVDPVSGSINFNAKQIKITFDEFVELNSPTDNAIFSPPLKHNPEFILTGKTLTVKLKDTLLSNRTYNIIFSDCIKDFTEGNKLSYYHYTFSTGNQVDSFSLHGQLINAETLKPEPGCLVFLYSSDIDSLPMTSRPDYISKSGSDGSFVFNNIAENNYKIFALKDMNSNLLYDMGGEGIAFETELVQAKKMLPPDTVSALSADSAQAGQVAPENLIRQDSACIKLQFFIPIDTIQKLLKINNVQKGVYSFQYKRPVYSFIPEVLKDAVLPDYFETKSLSGDTVTWYMKSTLSDTVRFVVQPEEGRFDTLMVTPFKKSKSQSRGRQRATVTSPSLTVSASHEGDLYRPLVLHFSYPIKPVDSFDATLIARKKSGNDTIVKTFSVPDTFVMAISLPFKVEEKVPYTLIIRDSVFYGYDGLVNDTVSVQFTTKSEKDYGNLTINYVSDKPGMSYIVNLLGAKDAVIQKNILTGSQTISYTNLTPGSYRIKVVEDRNKNGVWDTGNYFTKEQPETIFFFNKPIEIRGFWDLEEDFDFKEVRIDRKN